MPYETNFRRHTPRTYLTTILMSMAVGALLEWSYSINHIYPVELGFIIAALVIVFVNEKLALFENMIHRSTRRVIGIAVCIVLMYAFFNIILGGVL